GDASGGGPARGHQLRQGHGWTGRGGPGAMTRRACQTDRRLSQQVLARHSKSFALAGRLFPPATREDAAAVYAWCRRCDDVVDLSDPSQQASALLRVQEQLARLYAGTSTTDPI